MIIKFLFIIRMNQSFKCCSYDTGLLFCVEYLVFMFHYGSILNVRLGDVSGWYYFEY